MSQKSLKFVQNADIRPFKSEPTINVLNNEVYDFTSKSSEYATIKSRKQLYRRTSGMLIEAFNKSADLDLGVSLLSGSTEDLGDTSGYANKIIANALHIPRCLYCPFCSADYLKSRHLKNHLKNRHGNEILEMATKNKSITDVYEFHTCPFCSAVFYHFALIPLHLAQHHDSEAIKQWLDTGNMMELMNEKGCCPSIELFGCSSDMSKMLGSLDISGGAKDKNENQTLDTPLKSILKRKTNISGKIIFSASSASLRRIGDDVNRRSNNSVRRELRFDLPAPSISPVKDEIDFLTNNPLKRLEEPKEKPRRWFQFTKRHDKHVPNLFTSNRKSRHKQNNNSVNLITSTPISFLDGPFVPPPFTIPKNKRQWLLCGRRRKMKVPKLDHESSSFKPSFFASERYGCRICHKKYYGNVELVVHLRTQHSLVQRLLFCRYECGECSEVFYRNKNLVRHCNSHHTPKKLRY